MAGEKNLSDGRPAGCLVGQSATDKVGFYGTAPVAQQTVATAAALTAGETTPSDVAAAVVELYDALALIGIVA